MIDLLALLLYIGAFTLWVRVLFRGTQGRLILLASLGAAVAVTAHGIALLDFWYRYGELPLMGPGAALSSLAFVGGIALMGTLPIREVARVAIVILPFIVVLQGTALLFGIHPPEQTPAFQGAGFILHVTFAFLGYQGFTLAFAAGLLYLVQHHELKEKRMGRFYHYIPPLGTLDRLGRVGGWVGFVALSLALLFGTGWALMNPEAISVTDPKVIWAVGSWVLFLGVVLARLGRGRTEYRGALAAVAGFALVVLGYIFLRVVGASDGSFL